MTEKDKKSFTYDLVRKSNFEIELKRYCKIVQYRKNAVPVTKSIELVEDQILKFEPITEEEIIKKRYKKESGIIMIFFGQLFYTKAPKYIKISKMDELLRGHLCRNCMKLSAKSDEEGGCKKVRDWPIKFNPRSIIDDEENPPLQSKITKRDIIESMRIEKYPFLKFAMESINTTLPEILITDCNNFCKYPALF